MAFVMQDYKQVPIFVHTPPHLESELTRHVMIDGKVGVRPRSAKLIAAGAVSADKGPLHDRKPGKLDHRKLKVEGSGAAFALGDLRGALLADGDILRIVRRRPSALPRG